jgi:hypothetical protein
VETNCLVCLLCRIDQLEPLKAPEVPVCRVQRRALLNGKSGERCICDERATDLRVEDLLAQNVPEPILAIKIHLGASSRDEPLTTLRAALWGLRRRWPRVCGFAAKDRLRLGTLESPVALFDLGLELTR